MPARWRRGSVRRRAGISSELHYSGVSRRGLFFKSHPPRPVYMYTICMHTYIPYTASGIIAATSRTKTSGLGSGYLARMAAGLSRPAFLAAASLARVRPPFTEPKLVAAIDGFLAGSYPIQLLQPICSCSHRVNFFGQTRDAATRRAAPAREAPVAQPAPGAPRSSCLLISPA